MQKRSLFHFLLFLFVIPAIIGFHFSASAEDATSTPPSGEQSVVATTTAISEPSPDVSLFSSPSASSTTSVVEEIVPSPSPEPSPPSPLTSEGQAVSESSPPPPSLSPELSAFPPPPPSPPSSPVEPIVPIAPDGHTFDPATAPSKVRLKILNPDGSVPTIPVFVTYVGVGGRTYGGPIDREGAIETILPTGRYYTDILVLDTKAGPPSDPPSFFIEANEERDFGVLTLTNTSSFTDTALEIEAASVLEGRGGLAKMFSLVIKLLLAILREIRNLRSELVGR